MFYIFLSIKYIIDDDFEFCVDLFELIYLVIVLGLFFIEFGKGFVRIFYVYEMDVLKEGMKRFVKYLNIK